MQSMRMCTMHAMHDTDTERLSPTAYLPLPTCRWLPAAGHLPLATCRWPPAAGYLPLATCLAFRWLPAATRLPLATCHWLPACRWLPAFRWLPACRWLPAAGYLPLATCRWLPAAGYLPLATCLPLLIPTRCHLLAKRHPLLAVCTSPFRTSTPAFPRWSSSWACDEGQTRPGHTE